MKSTYILFILLFSFATLHSQNQYTKWYFGSFAAIDFMTSPPTPIGTSSMSGTGSSSIADQNGNLMFYSNGYTIWNQVNAVMANGNAISSVVAGSVAGQDVLIVKKPNSSSVYYVFTLLNNLAYSIVDMSLAAGMGSVTIKNQTLSPVFVRASKLTGTKHCNNNDYWIVCASLHPHNFYSYMLSSTGISTTAVVSTFGTDTISPEGYMKISPNGKRIALNITKVQNQITAPRLEVREFDNVNGTVSSNSIAITNFSINTAGYFKPYGVEFSPDGSKLYVSAGALNAFAPELYQFNLCAGNELAINNSRYIVNYDSTVYATGGALQLGPDGKIYKSKYSKQSLGVINNPNQQGVACNYNNNQQPLSFYASGTWDMPNFITSDFNASAPTQFFYTVKCQDVAFTGVESCEAKSYWPSAINWSFGDSSSGAANTSTVTNPTHYYAALGTYTTTLILTFPCRVDTFAQQITITNQNPTFSLTGVQSICKNKTGTLSAVSSTTQGAMSYSWSTVNITASLVTVSPTVTTIYTVTGTNSQGCKATNTVQLIVNLCTGLNDESLEASTYVYPNPNNGQFYIETSLAKINFIIYNQLGAQVYSGNATTGKHSLDISELANGIYFLKLSSSDRDRMIKLVKVD